MESTRNKEEGDADKGKESNGNGKDSSEAESEEFGEDLRGNGENGNQRNGNGYGNGNGKGGMPRKEALKDVTEKLGRLGVSSVAPIMAEKMATGTEGIARVRVSTNVRGVITGDEKFFRYDVTIEATFGSGKTQEISKRSRKDYISVNRKRVCMEVMGSEAVKRALKSVEFLYDGQKIMFTKLNLNIQDKPLVVHVDTKEFEARELRECGSVVVKVAQVITNFEQCKGDIARMSGDLRTMDRSFLQFIDIATSQVALNNPDRHVTYSCGLSYLMKPWEEGFREDDCSSLPEGKYVGVGAHKAAMLVEGPKGRSNCHTAIVVDTAKTAFHGVMKVLDKAQRCAPNLLQRPLDPRNLQTLRQQLRGVYAQVHTGCGPVFEITGVGPNNAKGTTFVYEGTKTSVFDYYGLKYGITLEHPQVPVLVSRKSADKVSYFPMELSYILDCQRVGQQQQTPAQLKDMKNACIIPPVKRIQQNEVNVKALGLQKGDSKWMEAVDVTVGNAPLVVDARILPPPKVIYGDRFETNVDPVRMWIHPQRQNYVFPASLNRWAIILLNGCKDKPHMGTALTEFTRMLIDAARGKGLRVEEPTLIDEYDEPTEPSIDEIFKLLSKRDCEFIFFIQADPLKLHDAIKDAERRYEIVTQDMKVSKAEEVVRKRQRQTLDNVINKMNVKLGGLNYGVMSLSKLGDVIASNRLFIGVSMSHPGPVSAAEMSRGPRIPSVVGFAFNPRNSTEFIGDFGFQDARRTDMVSLIGEFVYRIVNTYCKERNGAFPKEVIMFRAGVSEGEFMMIHQQEIPLIRMALKEAGCSNAKLTILVVNRMHKVRLAPADIRGTERPMDQNLRPGTVVDAQLVHPTFSEFYLNSHKALQGTAKTPRYTVVVDDSRMSLDELENITYSLCFAHQIVNLTTSVPTPLYVATRYAERGRRMIAYRNAELEASSDSASMKDFPYMDLDEANKTLSYGTTSLAKYRINA